MNENKIYVDVNATFTKDGMLLPKSFVWEDGVEYEISKVKDIRRAASLKAGGAGMRYTCVVDGKEVYLFYEDNNMWFMEKSASADHGLPWSTGFKISNVGASGQGASELPAQVMGLRRLISLSLASTNVACW